MTNYNLFAQATPTGVSSGTGNAGTDGIHFTVSSAATLEGIWHYSPSSSTQLPTEIGLYTTQAAPATGTLVTSNSATWLTGPGGSAASAGSGWVYAAFTSPPSLTSGTNYMATNFRNDATNEWFVYYSVTWPVTSAILTAPADVGGVSANSQGWYNNTTTTSMAFPTSQLGGDNFGMDVEVSTSNPVSVALAAGSQSVSARLLTATIDQSLLSSSGTTTAYPFGTASNITPQTASGTVSAHTFSIPGNVNLLAASVTQTALSPTVTVGAGANLLTASQSVNAYPLSPVYGGGSALLAAGQAVSSGDFAIPSSTGLLTASSASSAKNLTTIARVGLLTATTSVTAYSPTVIAPPPITVNLQTAVAATVTVNPIGFIPPTFVNLLPAVVNRGAVRVGPPNLPVMTMTYASGYDNYGNYIPKGFNLYGTQADQLTMSQDIYFIPQPVHGVTTNVFLPTVSFAMSQEYTTKTYNPSIMFATPNNIGFSYENTYTTINSGSINASGGSPQNTSGISLGSQSYDGTSPAYVSFRSGNGGNTTVTSDGLHVTSGTRVSLTDYNQSTNTTVQPGILGEINNQGTSNEFTTAYISAGATSGAGETYIYMGSASSSGSATNGMQFVMAGSVQSQYAPGATTFYGTVAVNQLLVNGATGASQIEVNGGARISGATELDSLTSLNGNSLPLSTVSSPSLTSPTTNETNLAAAINGLINRMHSLGFIS